MSSTISITYSVKDVGGGFRELSTDAESFRKVMGSVLAETQAFQKKAFESAAIVTTYNALRDSARGLQSALSSLTAGQRSFNDAMLAANTMAGKDGAGLAKLQDQVSELSTSVPMLRDQLAKGLYQTISNGVPEDNWMSFLESSSRAAVGGMADIEKVVGVTSTVIKNYGLSWEDAAAIQDKIQLTAKNGVTSFEQLAQALPRVTGNAATLGVSVNELMATFATLTGVSGNTAEVSTQLAAIFSALVKPSSEATKMAQEMGIQFDAAAIKAAGGLEIFLYQLDEAVQSYARQSGMLEQEVYGKLFGSAESLRALVPLQGELAQTFSDNVATMANSAGTMDAAFDTMSAKGENVIQVIRNQTAAFFDNTMAMLAAVEPYTSVAAGALETGANIASLYEVLKGFRFTLIPTNISLRTLNATLGHNSVATRAAVTVLRTLGYTMRGTTMQAKAMTVALRGILMASGVGLAIMAITAAVEALSEAFGNAKEKEDKFKESTDAFVRTSASVQTQIDNETRELKELMKAKGDTEEVVRRLNETYGKELGMHESAAEWYRILTERSEAYTKQKALEAQVEELTSQKYAAAAARRKWEEENKGKMRYGHRDLVTGTRNYFSTDSEWKELRADEDAATLALIKYQGELDEVRRKLDQMKKPDVATPTVPEEDKTTTTTPTDIPATTTAVAFNPDADNLKGYRANIQALTRELETATVQRAREINTEIDYWQALADTITEAGKAQKDLPSNVDKGPAYDPAADNLNGYRANIQALTRELETATMKRAEEINIEIEYWQELADAITKAGKAVQSNEPIYNEHASTIREISDNLAVLHNQLQDATLAEAAGINKSIKLWEDRRKAIQQAGTSESKGIDTIIEGYNHLKSVGSGIEGITRAIDGQGNAWQKITGVIDGAIQVYNGIMGIIGIINMFTGASAAQTTASAAQTAASAAQTAANEVETASYMKLAAAKTFAAHASIPFAGTGIASSMVATQMAVMAALKVPAFADGGIAYGPTLGIFGEYAGASGNPEVVAPLDRLTELISPAGGTVVVGGELRLRGTDLVAALANVTRTGARSGRRTNIII